MADDLDMQALLKGLLGGGTGEDAGASPPFDSFDTKMLFGMMDILGELEAEDDAARLIHSMKPFFSRERAAKVEQAVKVMKLARAAEAAMKLWGKKGEGE